MSHTYLRWPSVRSSWHIVDRIDAGGWWLRCGRVITTDSAKASDHIPSGEKSCESCLRGTLRDESSEDVTNDEVAS